MTTIVTIDADDQITSSRADINTNFANLNSDKIETSAIDTDTTLSANSDSKIPSQKAVKAYIDSGGSSEVPANFIDSSTGVSDAGKGVKTNSSGQISKSFEARFDVGKYTDGNVTISSGTTTLLRDMYYDVLTVNGTGILATAGYRIYARSVIVDSSSGAYIHNNGGNGGNGGTAGGGGGTGGTAGTAPAGVTLPAGAVGKVGAVTSALGNDGVTSDASTNSAGVAGGIGGNSGKGDSGNPAKTGGGVGTLTASKNRLAILPEAVMLATTYPTYAVVTGSTAGGSGAAPGTNNGVTGASGGGSGASGGWIFIAANKINLTGASCIQAKGGNGGNGGAGTVGGGAAGGGGGGGGGGVVILIANEFIGSGTVDVSGGTGGLAGTNLNGYQAPTAGTDGTVGNALYFYL